MASVQEENSNPYVQITASQWALGGVLLLAYLLTIGTLNVSSESPNVHLVYISFLAKTALLFAPFLVARVKGWGWFHPLVFTSLWLFVRQVLPKSGLFTDGLSYHEALPGYTEASLNLLVAYGLGLQAFALAITYLGYTTAPRLKVPSLSLAKPSRPLLKTILIGGIAGLAFYRIVSAVGGIGQLILLRGAGLVGRTKAYGGGQWIVLVEQLMNACVIWFATDDRAVKRLSFWGLFVLSLALVFGATGSRSGVLFPILFLLLIWSIRHHRIPFKTIGGAAVVGVFLIGFLGQLRGDRSLLTQPFSGSTADVAASPTEGFSEGIRAIAEYSGSAEGMYPVLARVPDEESLLLGKSYLSLLALPIPRAVWLNKPEAAGTLAGKVFFDSPGRGVPPGSVGEAYWNFHVLGIIAVFLAWGWFLKWIGRVYLENRESGAVVAFYAVTLLIARPHSPTLYEWILTLLPMVVLAYFILQRKGD
ncbi:MAG: hypothetical protein ABEK03_09280 [Candidatus Bipolaricaulia bacterium]